MGKKYLFRRREEKDEERDDDALVLSDVCARRERERVREEG